MVENRNDGDFPKGWEILKIEDAFRIFPTASYSRADLNEHDDTMYIHYGDIHTSFDHHIDLNYQVLPRISEDKVKKYEILQEGDLIVTDASEDYMGVGKAVEVINVGTNRIISGLHTFLLRDKSNLFSPNFKGYVLLSSFVRKQMYRLATGTKVYSVSKEALKSVKLSLPPLDEQKAIADCLMTWDKAITLQTQLIKEKQLRKTALMQQLLTGKKRLPGFTEEWKEVKLGELFSRVTRKNTEGNKNVVTISAQRGFVKQTDFFNKTVASDLLDNYYLVYKDEFCYNKSYSKGYPWGATKRLNTFDKAVVTTLYICFAVKDYSRVNLDYFEQLFQANSLDKGLTQIAYEGGRAHGLLNVSPNDFFNLKLRIPSLQEQTAVAEILVLAEKEVVLEQQKLNELTQQKKALMQQLLTGKVRLVS